MPLWMDRDSYQAFQQENAAAQDHAQAEQDLTAFDQHVSQLPSPNLQSPDRADDLASFDQHVQNLQSPDRADRASQLADFDSHVASLSDTSTGSELSGVQPDANAPLAIPASQEATSSPPAAFTPRPPSLSSSSAQPDAGNGPALVLGDSLKPVQPDTASNPPLAPSSGPTGSNDLVQAARDAAQKYGVDPETFVRQINRESGFSPAAVSPAGAKGVAQLMDATAQGLGVDPMDPHAALDGAARLMGNYLKQYNGDYRLALAAYNAGPGAVAQFGGVPPYPETQKYVDTIQHGAALQSPDRADARPSQFSLGLSYSDALAACGPAAAIALVRRYGEGSIPTAAVLQAAKQVGWNSQQGMAGVQSEQALLQNLGVQTKLETSVDWNHVRSDVGNGNPVILSTPGHYFVVDGVDPETGSFHVGTSGTDLKGGTEYMTPERMQSLMGSVSGALYVDKPGAPGPSVAEQQPDGGNSVLDAFDQHVQTLGNGIQTLGNGITNLASGAGKLVGNAADAVGSALPNFDERAGGPLRQPVADRRPIGPDGRPVGPDPNADLSPLERGAAGLPVNPWDAKNEIVQREANVLMPGEGPVPVVKGALEGALDPANLPGGVTNELTQLGIQAAKPLVGRALSVATTELPSIAAQVLKAVPSRLPAEAEANFAAGGLGNVIKTGKDILQNALDGLGHYPDDIRQAIGQWATQAKSEGLPDSSIGNTIQKWTELNPVSGESPTPPTDVVAPTGAPPPADVPAPPTGAPPPIGGGDLPPNEWLPSGAQPGQLSFDSPFPVGAPLPKALEDLPGGPQRGQLSFDSPLPYGGPRPGGTEELPTGAMPGQQSLFDNKINVLSRVKDFVNNSPAWSVLAEGKKTIFSLSNFHTLTLGMDTLFGPAGFKGLVDYLHAYVSPSYFKQQAGDLAYWFNRAESNGANLFSGTNPEAGAVDALPTAVKFGARSVAGAGTGFAAGYESAKISGADDSDAIRNGLIGAGAGAVLGPTVAQWMHSALWTRAAPLAKVMAFKAAVEGGAPAQEAATFVNNQLGGQNGGKIANAMMSNWGRLLITAPDFLTSQLKLAGAAAVGTAKSIPGVEALPGMGPMTANEQLSRDFWLKTIGTVGFVTEGLQYAFTGHFTNENQPGDQFKLELPNGKVDNRGQAEYTTVSLFPGNVQPLLDLAAQRDFGTWVHSRIAPVASTFADLYKNTDYRGQPIMTQGAPPPVTVPQGAGYIAQRYAPIGISGPEQQLAHGAPLPLVAAGDIFGLKVGSTSGSKELFAQRDQLVADRWPQLEQQIRQSPGFQSSNPARQQQILTEQRDLLKQDAAEKVGLPKTQTGLPPKYAGVTDPIQEQRIDQAIARVNTWERDSHAPRPSAEDRQLETRYGGRTTAAYQKAVQARRTQDQGYSAERQQVLGAPVPTGR